MPEKFNSGDRVYVQSARTVTTVTEAVVSRSADDAMGEVIVGYRLAGMGAALFVGDDLELIERATEKTSPSAWK